MICPLGMPASYVSEVTLDSYLVFILQLSQVLDITQWCVLLVNINTNLPNYLDLVPLFPSFLIS